MVTFEMTIAVQNLEHQVYTTNPYNENLDHFIQIITFTTKVRMDIKSFNYNVL